MGSLPPASSQNTEDRKCPLYAWYFGLVITRGEEGPKYNLQLCN